MYHALLEFFYLNPYYCDRWLEVAHVTAVVAVAEAIIRPS
jgi:hypothetical protein